MHKPNINEIYDTEENDRFMLVSSATYRSEVHSSDRPQAIFSFSFAPAAIYLHISVMPLHREEKFARLKPSTSCINYSRVCDIFTTR